MHGQGTVNIKWYDCNKYKNKLEISNTKDNYKSNCNMWVM